MKRLLLISGFLLLFAAEILRVYFIMPFPGSQQAETIKFAYWLSNHIFWIRILVIVLLIYPLYEIFTKGKKGAKIVTGVFVALYVVIFSLFNFKLEADKMFYQPGSKVLLSSNGNKVAKDKLVIGVMINGEAKAYPIQFIGYHHQVRDTVGNMEVMVTYCTVCRTGRVFSPLVNGKPETFRLVGMDHFNAMFEDATTKSWWQQATGKAIEGPLKGTSLAEFPSSQVTLASWLRQHPNSKVFQADSAFADEYKDMAKYDKGVGKSKLTKRDKGSWKPKSWVVGVVHDDNAKAYDWNMLVKKKLITDSLPGLPLAIFLEKDNQSFHALSRTLNGETLQFKINGDLLTDIKTASVWNMDGLCISGPLNGKQLTAVQAYQEFWHSWKTFHPQTTTL